MHGETLVAGEEVAGRPERIADDEHPPLRPPDRNLLPTAVLADGAVLERRSLDRRLREHVYRHPKSRGERFGVPTVPVDELEHAGGVPRCADPLFDAVAVRRVDDPDAAVHDQHVRAALEELVVDDPAEAAVE